MYNMGFSLYKKKNVGFPTFLCWKKTTFLLSHKHNSKFLILEFTQLSLDSQFTGYKMTLSPIL